MGDWWQANRARYQGALETRKHGDALRQQGFQNLMTPIFKGADMLFTGTQAEKERQLKRDLPLIGETAKVRGTEMDRQRRAKELGLYEQEAAPVIPPNLTSATEAGPVVKPNDGAMTVPPVAGREQNIEELFLEKGSTSNAKKVSDGTKYPNQYAEEVTGNKADWPKLKFVKDGKEVPYVEAWDPATEKVLPGVVVDTSALTGGTQAATTEPQIQPFDEWKKVMSPPGAEPGAPTPAAEVIPAAAKIPEAPRKDILGGSPNPAKERFDWENEPPQPIGRALDEYDLGVAKKKSFNDERYNILRDSVKQEHPDWSRSQIDSEAKTLYLGWYYGQQGGADKDKSDDAMLFNYAMSVKQLAKEEPGIKQMLNADGSIKQGFEDKYYDALSDFASRNLPTAFPRGAFKTRPEYNSMFDIIVPTDAKSREKSNAFFRDLYKNGSIPAGITKTEEGGGGAFSFALSMSPIAPIAKAITADKMGAAESDKMWDQMSKENVAPFKLESWIDQYLKDHGFKPLTREDRVKIEGAKRGATVGF